MTDLEVWGDLIRKLKVIIERLPNGLLHRLLNDAEFFEDWNMSKKRARGSSRMAQHKATLAQIEEVYWKKINRPGSSRVR